jgi:hypothetical protein
MFSFLSLIIFIGILVLIIYIIFKKSPINTSACTGECDQGRKCNCELAEDNNDIQQDQRT